MLVVHCSYRHIPRLLRTGAPATRRRPATSCRRRRVSPPPAMSSRRPARVRQGDVAPDAPPRRRATGGGRRAASAVAPPPPVGGRRRRTARSMRELAGVIVSLASSHCGPIELDGNFDRTKDPLSPVEEGPQLVFPSPLPSNPRRADAAATAADAAACTFNYRRSSAVASSPTAAEPRSTIPRRAADSASAQIAARRMDAEAALDAALEAEKPRLRAPPPPPPPPGESSNGDGRRSRGPEEWLAGRPRPRPPPHREYDDRGRDRRSHRDYDDRFATDATTAGATAATTGRDDRATTGGATTGGTARCRRRPTRWSASARRRSATT